MNNNNITLAKPPMISVAPMLGWTNRHCRYFHRLLTKKTRLYTEMITTGAILHGNQQRFLQHDEAEHPLALQLAGNDPSALARCCKIAETFNYDEINLNVGCPSARVQSGQFGACLMAKPALVADCIKAMQDATPLPVTVKSRIGIDHTDSDDSLFAFIDTLAKTRCQTFIIHARKAWLEGLNPKQNRHVPPLRYDSVYRLKKTFPSLNIILNGGIQTYDDIATHLSQVDGVMIGREAYQHPYLLSEIDQRFFQDTAPIISREQVIENLRPYIEQQKKNGLAPKSITRHILGLQHGMPGARAWRRRLATGHDFL
jgi:tRNA-dihydrouridine synthase A